MFNELFFEIVNFAASGDFFTDGVGAGVRRSDNDAVAEADFAIFFVTEDAFVKNLEEGSEDGGVSFFDFVEKDDGEGLLHNLSGEAEFVGGAVFDEAGDVGAGNKFVHIEAEDVIFAVEVDGGEGFGKFGFADTGRAEEEEGTDGTVLIFDAGGSATESVGNGGDGFLLVDHALVDEMF